MKTKWICITTAGLLAILINSCSNSGSGGPFDGAAKYKPAPASSELRSGDQASHRSTTDAILNKPGNNGISSSEAFATPRKERPGLATGFGPQENSPMPSTNFTRATSRPYGIDVLYYNDREGLKAMGALGEKVSPMRRVAGEVLEWGVKGSFGYLPTYDDSSWYSSRRRFVQGTHGGLYSIVLKNRCKSDLQVVLSVDGLDVLDGKPASVTKRGYVIPAGQTLEVPGYRTSYNSVARFQFSSVSNSYAGLSRGDTRNVGVIGLAVYTAKGQNPWTWMPGEIKQRENANPFAQAP